MTVNEADTAAQPAARLDGATSSNGARSTAPGVLASKSLERSKKASMASQKPAAKKDKPSPKANRSPSKPSPLGSSPPTNASDFESDCGRASSSSSSPLMSQLRRANGSRFSAATNDQVSLKRKAEDHHLRQDSPKRPQARVSSPSSSDAYYSASSVSPPTSHRILHAARTFKEDYANYERLYREIVCLPDPPADKVLKVKKMHQRLLSMKVEIAAAGAGF